jgi:hypothetical protein
VLLALVVVAVALVARVLMLDQTLVALVARVAVTALQDHL